MLLKAGDFMESEMCSRTLDAKLRSRIWLLSADPTARQLYG
jgi:hypothetical protein